MSEAAQTPEAEAAAPSSKRKLIPVLALVGSLLLGAGAGAAVIGPRLFASPAEAAEEAAHESDDGDHGAAGSALVALENLVVNPANSGGTRFLLISVAFEPRTEAVAAALGAAEPQLRDTFVTLLGKRSIAELSDLGVREVIRAELLAAADSIVPGIRRIYIPQFVLQ